MPESENIVADPPEPFDMNAARTILAAIDRLPRPTLVTCRGRTTAPRRPCTSTPGSAVGSIRPTRCSRKPTPTGAPFAGTDAYRDFVTQGLEELRAEEGAP